MGKEINALTQLQLDAAKYFTVSSVTESSPEAILEENNKRIAEFLGKLTLCYGFLQPLEDSRTVVRLQHMHEEEMGDLIMEIPLDALINVDNKGNTTVYGVCQQHSTYIAQVINAMTNNDGLLVQPTLFVNNSITHILPVVQDTSLASVLPRDKIDPAEFNRNFDLSTAENEGFVEPSFAGKLIKTDTASIKFGFEGENMGITLFTDTEGNIYDFDIKHYAIAYIGESQGKSIGVFVTRKENYALIFLTYAGDIATMIAIQRETKTIQRVRESHNEDVNTYAQLLIRRLDMNSI